MPLKEYCAFPVEVGGKLSPNLMELEEGACNKGAVVRPKVVLTKSDFDNWRYYGDFASVDLSFNCYDSVAQWYSSLPTDECELCSGRCPESDVKIVQF